MSPSIFTGSDDERLRRSGPRPSPGIPPPGTPIANRPGILPVTVTGATYADYYRAAALTIADDTDTVIDFDTAVEDTHSCVVVGATWKYTSPFYKVVNISTVVTLNTDADWVGGELGYLYVFVNGVVKAQLDRFDNISSRGTLTGHIALHLAPGDYFQIVIHLDAGGSVGVNTTAGSTWITVSG